MKLNSKSRAFNCVYCDTLIKEEWAFFGKKLYIDIACPHCGLRNEFPLLNKHDQRLLRLGFLFNPFYLPKKTYVDGAPFKLVALFYPLLFIVYVLTNVLYMPFGLVYNNIKISRSKQRFYLDNEHIDARLIYFGNLRKLADDGDHYAALLVGRNFLYGETYAQNNDFANHYLEVASLTYPVANLERGLNAFYQADYEAAYRYFSASQSEAKSLYYLAVMHVKGFGVAKNTRLAKQFLLNALPDYTIDPYNIKHILRR